ncbi:phosphopyruvate hydratase [Ureaplasma sp. ES3154-GEN]|uniref:phosphopyruvate hydratase n=1 Tax=Ureaplasma sp. ES3154-GEN TaxID=2984844 RepID=UPI0021E7E583|nr:phosphopyruvate hydratase [Ureaplasma sp. ES3154-GEN]MCV3743719.1 phosphopyruvate hydratase [Ureaplasma sp. ES3154-GEN]
MYIKNILAYQILDSRGYPTVAVRLQTSDQTFVYAKVPSGASTGTREALELRDNNPNYFFNKSVLKAISNINQTLAPLFINKPLNDFKKLDQLLIDQDNEQKSIFGANAILALSIAFLKASAYAAQKPLYQYIKEDLLNNFEPFYYAPIPMMNFINGGAHADNNLTFQEFMIMPVGANDFAHAVQMGAEIFYQLHQILKKDQLATTKGDEGGYAPSLSTNQVALDYISKAITSANYTPVKNEKIEPYTVGIALDVAGSEFFDNNSKKYILNINDQKVFYDSAEFTKYLLNLVEAYPILSIEDPFDENEWVAFTNLTKTKKVQVVGDDLYTTNKVYLQRGIDTQATSAILIKPNQIGSVSETLETIQLAQQNNIKVIISHRSGETEDDFIADLAIGVGADMIKTGSLSRSERIAKYNRILEIQTDLKNNLIYQPHKK